MATQSSDSASSVTIQRNTPSTLRRPSRYIDIFGDEPLLKKAKTIAHDPVSYPASSLPSGKSDTPFAQQLQKSEDDDDDVKTKDEPVPKPDQGHVDVDIPDDVILSEMHGDLLEMATDGMPIVHCINAECRLGAGIAKMIESRYHIACDLYNLNPKVGDVFDIQRTLKPDCRILHIYNLVTKQSPYDLPTYEALRTTLGTLRKHCDSDKSGIYDILCMPRIGCGLDKLEWPKVKKLIIDTFRGSHTHVRIYVYP